jgi:hypothetical protein
MIAAMGASAELNPSVPLASRAWYSAFISEFLQTPSAVIVGQLAAGSGFTLLSTQTDAWLAQIALLQERLGGLNGALFLEFNIPRMGRRIDAVLLIGPVVFVIEFKVGESVFDSAAVDQVWDYALDLKNFHEASHAASIVPILVATEATVAKFYGLTWVSIRRLTRRQRVQMGAHVVPALFYDCRGRVPPVRSRGVAHEAPPMCSDEADK